MPDRPVAFLGPEGTFSHLLAAKRFRAAKDLRSCQDLGGVFDVLAKNQNAVAVAPIENSSGGTIYDTIDLLIRNAGSVFVQEDLVLDVQLALIGHSSRKITKIYSHFVPLQHHREWLEKHYPDATLEAVASTALAASLAAKSKTAAALAAKSTALANGLKVLVFPIRPQQVNVTRFYVVGNTPAVPPKEKPAKTALVVRLKNQCGSLHSFLGPFAKRKVNLRMIVSRPVPGHPETYQFYVELEGAGGDPALDSAMMKAASICDSVQLLGSFPTGKRFSS